jgi:hypothetical protein
MHGPEGPPAPGTGHAQALERVRRICAALPETNERPSHGSPAFFIRDTRCFATFLDDHHGDGRLALWCAAPPEMQRVLVEGAPEHYFVPPYVGHRGWIGVRLDRDASWDEIAGVLEDAWLTIAPKSLIRATGLAGEASGAADASGGTRANRV